MSELESDIEPEIQPETAPLTAAQPHLSLQLSHRLGALQIDAAFTLTQPWTVLFGASGSGKSTILRAIAGLFRPDRARIVLRHGKGEQIVIDTAQRIFLPPHRRAIRWCAQRPALFPHMTVRENLRMAASSLSNPEETAGEALDRFLLTSLAEAMPATLSGGEQQRVALARAVVASDGKLLLLDEPFSGLDAARRDELLAILRTWLGQSGTPVLSVTHDIGESFLLDAEVIRLEKGLVTRQGSAAEVLAAERLRLLAQLR